MRDSGRSETPRSRRPTAEAAIVVCQVSDREFQDPSGHCAGRRVGQRGESPRETPNAAGNDHSGNPCQSQNPVLRKGSVGSIPSSGTSNSIAFTHLPRSPLKTVPRAPTPVGQPWGNSRDNHEAGHGGPAGSRPTSGGGRGDARGALGKLCGRRAVVATARAARRRLERGHGHRAAASTRSRSPAFRISSR